MIKEHAPTSPMLNPKVTSAEPGIRLSGCRGQIDKSRMQLFSIGVAACALKSVGKSRVQLGSEPETAFPISLIFVILCAGTSERRVLKKRYLVSKMHAENSENHDFIRRYIDRNGIRFESVLGQIMRQLSNGIREVDYDLFEERLDAARRDLIGGLEQASDQSWKIFKDNNFNLIESRYRPPKDKLCFNYDLYPAKYIEKYVSGELRSEALERIYIASSTSFTAKQLVNECHSLHGDILIYQGNTISKYRSLLKPLFIIASIAAAMLLVGNVISSLGMEKIGTSLILLTIICYIISLIYDAVSLSKMAKEIDRLNTLTTKGVNTGCAITNKLKQPYKISPREIRLLLEDASKSGVLWSSPLFVLLDQTERERNYL